MTSSDSDIIEDILTEMKHLSLKRKQLMERRKIQSIFQEMRNRAEFGQTEEAASNLHEVDNIDDKLKQLTERKAELLIHHDNILNAKDMTNGKKAESKDAEDMKNGKKAESKFTGRMSQFMSLLHYRYSILWFCNNPILLC